MSEWKNIDTAPAQIYVLVCDSNNNVMEAYWDGRAWVGSFSRYPDPVLWRPLPLAKSLATSVELSKVKG
jgi:hypothetical protein